MTAMSDRSFSDIPIVLALPLEHAWGRAMACGAAVMARQHPGWTIEMVTATPVSLARLVRRRPRGLIVPIVSLPQAKACMRLHRRCGTAVVNVGWLLPGVPFPHVGNDDAAIGHAAAEHLLHCGFVHFGFYGMAGVRMSALRRAGFAELVEQAGYRVSAYCQSAPPRTPAGVAPAVMAWLGKLAKPVGIFADSDPLAYRIAQTCRVAGLRVPEQVAIVGTDNDRTLCQLATPPLSSVAVAMERIGFAAAARLARMLDGTDSSVEPLFVPPLGVVARQSSDITAVEDKDLAGAIRWIRRNAARNVGIEELVAATGLSRSTLQRRFREILGHTVGAELRWTRLRMAKQLLADTDLPLGKVARRAGYRRVEYLHDVFHQQNGMTLSGYRRQFRPILPRQGRAPAQVRFQAERHQFGAD
ncbi:MAG: substrate-binding domain-containing protein [Phycisphaerae bacterium]